MPPIANTARPREAPTAPAHPGSDAEIDEYHSGPHEAEATRARVKKVPNDLPFHISWMTKNERPPH